MVNLSCSSYALKFLPAIFILFEQEWVTHVSLPTGLVWPWDIGVSTKHSFLTFNYYDCWTFPICFLMELLGIAAMSLGMVDHFQGYRIISSYHLSQSHLLLLTDSIRLSKWNLKAFLFIEWRLISISTCNASCLSSDYLVVQTFLEDAVSFVTMSLIVVLAHCALYVRGNEFSHIGACLSNAGSLAVSWVSVLLISALPARSIIQNYVVSRADSRNTFCFIICINYLSVRALLTGAVNQ